MITKKFSRVALLLAIAAAALVFVNCHGGNWGGYRDKDPHKRADKIVHRMEKELDLTSDQTARIRVIAYGIADSMQARRAEAMQDPFHEEMLRQLRETSVDSAALNKALNDRAAEMQRQSAERRARMIRDFTQLHDILTPTQRDKLADFLEKHGNEFKAHW